MHGKLYFHHGTMNSGKSLFLLATAHNFHERGIPYIILKSSIDDRDGESVIHSRALGDKECVSISTDDNLFKLILDFINSYSNFSDLKWILVDECQFLTPKQVDELAAIVDMLNINVSCYGLRTDFQTHLFPGSKRLFEVADTIEEVKSSCYCNDKTIFNARIDSNGDIVTDGEQIEIGGDDRYVALCRKCYYKKLGKDYYREIEEDDDYNE